LTPPPKEELRYMIHAYAHGTARRELRVPLLLLLAMTCAVVLWPSSAQAASITYKGEYESGLDVTLKFVKKNGTLRLQQYKTPAPQPEELYVAKCDGGGTTNWVPGSGFASQKVTNDRFVVKSEGENFGPGKNTTKFVGELKGKRVEGTFTWKNFDNGTQTGCNGKASYTATK
jgi:hypothetical protein